ncbi:MAG: hypothetical protein ABI230_07590 [Aestuariivirga sp.]
MIYALGLIGIYYSETGLMLDLTTGLLVGLGVAFSFFSIVMAALGRLVPPQKCSWAFGLATASGSLGQALFIWPVGQTISSFGWNNALVAMAIAALVIIPLAAPLLIQNTSRTVSAKGETTLPMGKAITKAFSHHSFLLLFFDFFVCGFQ